MAVRVAVGRRTWRLARRELLALGVAAGVVEVLLWTESLPAGWWRLAVDGGAAQLGILATIFLGIFLEGLPFLLFGVLVSAVLQVYVSGALLERILPRHGFLAALLGGCLGWAVPICECGAAPVARKLLRKGAPLSLGVAFMLAAPIVNPLVLLSTSTAFPNSPGLVAGRLGIALFVAVAIGVLFHQLQPNATTLTATQPDDRPGRGPLTVMRVAADEFLELAPYLVFGGLAAASLQTLVPRNALLALGQDPVLSVLAMMVLAVLLSVCSSVDAFVALSFSGTFSAGALLAFLLFGPLVNLKSAAMYATVLPRPAVLAMLFLCSQFVFLAGVFVNLNLV